MNREELQALIDKVIGKRGIMRSSSWWVRRLFSEVLQYSEDVAKAKAQEAVKGVKVVADTEMSDKSTNSVQNKVIKEYVDTAIGDIGSIIDNINGEVK